MSLMRKVKFLKRSVMNIFLSDHPGAALVVILTPPGTLTAGTEVPLQEVALVRVA